MSELSSALFEQDHEFAGDAETRFSCMHPTVFRCDLSISGDDAIVNRPKGLQGALDIRAEAHAGAAMMNKARVNVGGTASN